MFVSVSVSVSEVRKLLTCVLGEVTAVHDDQNPPSLALIQGHHAKNGNQSCLPRSTPEVVLKLQDFFSGIFCIWHAIQVVLGVVVVEEEVEVASNGGWVGVDIRGGRDAEANQSQVSRCTELWQQHFEFAALGAQN